jgi:hypothetical protein
MFNHTVLMHAADELSKAAIAISKTSRDYPFVTANHYFLEIKDQETGWPPIGGSYGVIEFSERI